MHLASGCTRRRLSEVTSSGSVLRGGLIGTDDPAFSEVPSAALEGPAPEVLHWIRGMSDKKQRRNVVEGLRVKVSWITAEVAVRKGVQTAVCLETCFGHSGWGPVCTPQ